MLDMYILYGFAAVVGLSALGSAVAIARSAFKQGTRKDLAAELGPAFLVVEASSGRIAVRVQRDDRVFEAKISLGSGENRWFVTSARPPALTPWRTHAAQDGLKDELEGIMARGRALRVTMVGGAITVVVLRGITAVDIEEAIDVAAEVAAVIDRAKPSAVDVEVDPSLFAHEPRDAVGGTSGAPFGVSTGDRS
jgi:hypothetical protein